MPKFMPGVPRPPNGGRKKGSRNKIGIATREAFLRVYKQIGGDAGFAEWAMRHRLEFYTLLRDFIPREVRQAVFDEHRRRTCEALAHFSSIIGDAGKTDSPTFALPQSLKVPTPTEIAAIKTRLVIGSGSAPGNARELAKEYKLSVQQVYAIGRRASINAEFVV